MPLPSVYPYREVTFDRTRTYPSGRTFRVIAYCHQVEGYDTPAGAAVFDEDRKMVLVDGLFAEVAPDALQGQLEAMMAGDLRELVASVNGHPWRRFSLDAEGELLLNQDGLPHGFASEYQVQ